MRLWIAIALQTLGAAPALAQLARPVPLVRVDVSRPPSVAMPGTRSTISLRAVVARAPVLPFGAPTAPVWSWQITRVQRYRGEHQWEDVILADRLIRLGEDTAQPTVMAVLPDGAWRLLAQVTAVWYTSELRRHEVACATTAAWLGRIVVQEPPRITISISIDGERPAGPTPPEAPPTATPPDFSSRYASTLDSGATATKPAASPVQVGLLGDRGGGEPTVSLERTEDVAVWHVVVRTRAGLPPPLAVIVDALPGLFRDTARYRLSPACYDPATDAQAALTRREMPLLLPTRFPEPGFPVFSAQVE